MIREPVGIPFLWVEVQTGKRLVTVDTSITPNVPIYEDIPKSETEILKEQVDSFTIAIAEMMGV